MGYSTSNWECWLYNAIHELPADASLADAIKVEETLKNLYKEITGHDPK